MRRNFQPGYWKDPVAGVGRLVAMFGLLCCGLLNSTGVGANIGVGWLIERFGL